MFVQTQTSACSTFIVAHPSAKMRKHNLLIDHVIYNVTITFLAYANMKLAAGILHRETGRWEGRIRGRKEGEIEGGERRREGKGGGKMYQIISVKMLGYQQ